MKTEQLNEKSEMLNDAKLEGKIKRELTGYKKIAIYGTGDNAKYLMPFLRKMGIFPFIVAIVDRYDREVILRI